ncbi:FeoC-like transcriptional regulator [Rhodobacter sp. JA431]|uniref:FeoC-like transcriptional regulator n=1 Tax=Rhodobacter sp. JA431 TaxID=570013 RepID=UPI000BD89962|nr:FeoC-like transcriptional regulator [Rhodobacter sp. JA431]
MSLREIEAHVIACGKVSLSDLSLHFGCAPDAMREMTAKLVRKGRLELSFAKSTCSGCGNKACCAGAAYYSPPEAQAAPSFRKETLAAHTDRRSAVERRWRRFDGRPTPSATCPAKSFSQSGSGRIFSFFRGLCGRD